MKKNIIKKIIIKICRMLSLELIDQNTFNSPTLNKEIDENLSNINKSIVIPLGEVKLKRKISSLLILFRTNTEVQIWDQNKKRIFEKPKIEYVLKSLKSLVKSINYVKKNNTNLNINLKVIDDKSTKENLEKLKKILSDSKIEFDIINHNNLEHKDIIKDKKNEETYSNLSSLLKSFEIGKTLSDDLIYFVEDDYLHFESSLDEMVSSYERISSQIERDLFICPADYPYLYMSNEKTTLLIGSKRHWRTISKTLCTFMVSKKLIEKYWDNFFKTCIERNEPFEKHLNEIYKKEICISPVKSLSLHMTNINSSYGLSPFINYKSLWEEN